ncbi:hypothetical protein AAY473_015441 [Plecturocebus cupreus]
MLCVSVWGWLHKKAYNEFGENASSCTLMVCAFFCIFKKKIPGWSQWLRPVILELWKAKAGGGQEFETSLGNILQQDAPLYKKSPKIGGIRGAPAHTSLGSIGSLLRRKHGESAFSSTEQICAQTMGLLPPQAKRQSLDHPALPGELQKRKFGHKTEV